MSFGFFCFSFGKIALIYNFNNGHHSNQHSFSFNNPKANSSIVNFFAESKLKSSQDENQRYICSTIDFRSIWACNLQGVIIAKDFSMSNHTSLDISSYPFQDINEITTFESNKQNIVIPYQYMPFYQNYYFNGVNCTIKEINLDSRFECNSKQFPSILFVIQDFGISFDEYYSPFYKTIRSKLVFRKGLNHWILGNEVLKKYTISFNIIKNSISFSSKSNDIIPFKWHKNNVYITKLNIFFVIVFLLIIGLVLGISIKIKINQQGQNKKSIIESELKNELIKL